MFALTFSRSVQRQTPLLQRTIFNAQTRQTALRAASIGGVIGSGGIPQMAQMPQMAQNIRFFSGSEDVKKSLYERLGGAPAVDAAVDLFYKKVLKDERINWMFDETDMKKQIAHQKKFMTQAFGGPEEYLTTVI